MNTTFYYKGFFLLFFIQLFCFQTHAAKGTKVFLEHADELNFNKTKNNQYQVLKGNVRFNHDGALLFCDSAYFYAKGNSLDAFGNVKMKQGDTLSVYGDVLYYNGDTKMARLRNNVKMTNRKMTLTTDSLNYDREANVGYFFNGGEIKDGSNVLVSDRGYYYPSTRMVEFKKNVILTHPDIKIESDTLKYNTRTKVAFLFGPTTITHKGTQVYSENGWYNTNTQYAALFDRSVVKAKGGRTLTADTLYYNRTREIANAYKNIVLKDSVQQLTLKGNLAFYNNKVHYAMITDSALAIEHQGKDSLFLHADTLIYTKDSVFDVLKAYRHARFYRTDVQGKSDSMVYSSKDSVLTLFHEPFLWAQESQLSGDKIRLFTKNGTIDYIHVTGTSMAVMKEDTLHFNQLLGKEIKGYIKNSDLYKVEVSGNTQSIYFPKENDETLIGLNKAESSYLTVHLKDKKIEKVLLFPESNGKLIPLEKLQKEDMFYPSFTWQEGIRPQKMEDVFLKFALSEKKDVDSKKKRKKDKK